jgi:hypothetical protein
MDVDVWQCIVKIDKQPFHHFSRLLLSGLSQILQDCFVKC